MWMTQATSRIDEHVREAATETVAKAQRYMLSIQYEEGYWWGELESNPTIEAEYLMLTHILGAPDPERWRKIANYILGRQQEDGSWAQYYGAPGNLSTCVECYTALKMAGIPANSPAMTMAREFILSKGGVPNTRVFTKIWLAMLGQYPWKNLPAMPPEVMFLPTWFPLNIYEFSSWARATIVPMTIILTEKPTTPIPEFAAIPELFPRQNGHKPSTNGLSRPIASWRTLFNGADKVLRLYEKAPIKPGRAWAKGLARPVDPRPTGGRRLLGRHSTSLGVLPHLPQASGLPPGPPRHEDGPPGLRGLRHRGGRYLAGASLHLPRLGYLPRA